MCWGGEGGKGKGAGWRAQRVLWAEGLPPRDTAGGAGFHAVRWPNLKPGHAIHWRWALREEPGLEKAPRPILPHSHDAEKGSENN